MEHNVYSTVTRVWLIQARRQVGRIAKGEIVANPYGFTRKDARISDWFANEGLNRRHFRLIPGFIARHPFTSVNLVSR